MLKIKKSLLFLLFISFLAHTETYKIDEAFGIKLGAKESSFIYKINKENGKKQIIPPAPMVGLTEYFIGTSSDYLNTSTVAPSRINWLAGIGKFKSIKACQKPFDKIKKIIKQKYHIDYHSISNTYPFMLSAKFSVGDDTISLSCINSPDDSKEFFLELTFSSALSLPYFDELFGVKMNEKPENLTQYTKRKIATQEIYQISLPKNQYKLDSLTLLLSPKTEKVRTIIAHKIIPENESCQIEKHQLAEKLESQYLMHMRHSKEQIINRNKDFGLTVLCRTSEHNSSLLLIFYQHKYGIDANNSKE